jgi:hypothetical protein
VTLAGGVFDEDDLASSDVAGFAITGSDVDRTSETDDVLATRSGMPSIRKIGGYFAYHEASRWHPF